MGQSGNWGKCTCNNTDVKAGIEYDNNNNSNSSDQSDDDNLKKSRSSSSNKKPKGNKGGVRTS